MTYLIAAYTFLALIGWGALVIEMRRARVALGVTSALNWVDLLWILPQCGVTGLILLVHPTWVTRMLVRGAVTVAHAEGAPSLACRRYMHARGLPRELVEMDLG